MSATKRRIGVAVATVLCLSGVGLAIGAADGAARQPATTASSSLQSHVETNIREALASLGAGAAGSPQRAERFRALMTRFADINAISTNVLGRYAGVLRTDAALNREWEATFTEYAFATYEDQLDRFRGYTVRAIAETINRPGQDAIVRTELTAPNGGRPVTVQWRMLNRGAGWRVYDVLVNLRGNELWLGSRQKLRFEDELNKTRGDIRALIAVVRQNTAAIRSRLAQTRR